MEEVFETIESNELKLLRNLFCNGDFSFGRQVEFVFLIFNKIKRDLIANGVRVDENRLIASTYEHVHDPFNDQEEEELFKTLKYFIMMYVEGNDEPIIISAFFRDDIIYAITFSHFEEHQNIVYDVVMQSFKFLQIRVKDLIQVLNVLKTARKYRKQVAIQEISNNGPYPGDDPATSRLSNIVLYSIVRENEQYIRKNVKKKNVLSLPSGTEYSGEVLFERLEELLLSPTVGFI